MGKKPHYTKLLKAFIRKDAGGLARVELYRLGLIESYAAGPKWRPSKLGRERAERLGYLTHLGAPP